jgi:hypothetical protein
MEELPVNRLNTFIVAISVVWLLYETRPDPVTLMAGFCAGIIFWETIKYRKKR